MTVAGKEPSPEAFTAVTCEHHVAYEAMERALAAKDRAIRAVRVIGDAVAIVLLSTTFDATLQPSAELLNTRAAYLCSRDTETTTTIAMPVRG